MRIAHLILTHKNPKQLERLIKALDHPSFDFYIHIDNKTDAAPFLYLVDNKRVFLVKNRTKIYWASYGTIQATINGFKEILPGNYDYINVISGQDFPLKPATHIYEYIVKRKGTEFIMTDSIYGNWKEAAVRVEKYFLVNWQLPGKHQLEKIINKILPKRKFPFDFDIVGRANWFTLTSDACKYALDFIEKHPQIVRFFKYSWGADELIWSTVLYNSDFRNKIADNLIYVDWTGHNDGHPRILTPEDFSKLKATDKLFGRKIDMDTNSKIIDLLEELIKNEQLPVSKKEGD